MKIVLSQEDCEQWHLRYFVFDRLCLNQRVYLFGGRQPPRSRCESVQCMQNALVSRTPAALMAPKGRGDERLSMRGFLMISFKEPLALEFCIGFHLLDPSFLSVERCAGVTLKPKAHRGRFHAARRCPERTRARRDQRSISVRQTAEKPIGPFQDHRPATRSDLAKLCEAVRVRAGPLEASNAHIIIKGWRLRI